MLKADVVADPTIVKLENVPHCCTRSMHPTDAELDGNLEVRQLCPETTSMDQNIDVADLRMMVKVSLGFSCERSYASLLVSSTT
jgi:hypothetical protein